MNGTHPSTGRNVSSKRYLVVEDALSDEDLNPLIADFEELIDTIADGLYAEGKIRERHKTQPFEQRIAWLTKEAGDPLQGQVSFPVNLRRPIFDFLHNANLLDLLESLVGPEIYCNPTHHVRPKLPEPLMDEGFDNWIHSPVSSGRCCADAGSGRYTRCDDVDPPCGRNCRKWNNTPLSGATWW